MKTIAKLYVSAVNQSSSTPGEASPQTIIHFNAVYSPDPQSENYSWSKATPSGTMKVSTRKDHDFRAGRTYRVYIEPKDGGDGVRTILERPNEESIRVRIETPKFEVVDGVKTYHGEWMEIELWVNNHHAWPTFTGSEQFKIVLMPCELTEGS